MSTEAATETAALIANLWQRNLPALRERLDILDNIATSAATGDLTKEEQDQAIAISHKLAGSLGMYGYTEGTEVAMKMESLLRSEEPLDAGLLIGLTYELREAIFPTTH